MSNTDHTEIRAALDGWSDALRRKDADEIIARQSDDVVQFSLAPPLYIVGAAKAELQAWLDSWEGDLDYELANLAIHSSGDIAWCTCLTRLGGKKAGTPPDSFWMRQTIGLERRQGAWIIVHTHESVPFSMEGEPVGLFDLQP